MEASSPSSSVLVELRIELPAHGHSFTLSVPSSSSIEDVKKEIHKHLTGAPRVDGYVSSPRSLSSGMRI